MDFKIPWQRLSCIEKTRNKHQFIFPLILPDRPEWIISIQVLFFQDSSIVNIPESIICLYLLALSETSNYTLIFVVMEIVIIVKAYRWELHNAHHDKAVIEGSGVFVKSGV